MNPLFLFQVSASWLISCAGRLCRGMVRIYIFDWGEARQAYAAPSPCFSLFGFCCHTPLYLITICPKKLQLSCLWAIIGPKMHCKLLILRRALRCVLFDKRNAFPYNLFMRHNWHTAHAVYTGFMSAKPFLSASKQTIYTGCSVCTQHPALFSHL